MAALNANYSPDPKDRTPNLSSAPGSGHLEFEDDSPYLDFDPDADFGDETFDFEDGRMIGDMPSDLHEKRKSVDGKDDDDEGGGKRREGDDKTAKKPGRKPLTSEPTSKRKAQNRAAQRAFRERKEKHLKDLETKVEDLEKASESANHENGLLRAQVERLQVELKEYRKRLSWVSSNGFNRSQPSASNPARNPSLTNSNDFQFEFPKFGDLPPMPATNLFNKPAQSSAAVTNAARSASIPTSTTTSSNPGANARRAASGANGYPARAASQSQSPLGHSYTQSPQPVALSKEHHDSVDSLTGLFSPSILEASRHASLGGYFPQPALNQAPATNGRPSFDNGLPGTVSGVFSNSSLSNTDSPGSSSESHHAVSSIGTSPEPSLNSPANKLTDFNLNTISEEHQLAYGGYSASPGFDVNGINWLGQQNPTFDPVLFGDYRETQDNILSQDFGAFFNDAYPLPDLGSPLHNYNDVAVESVAPKNDLLKQVELAKNGTEEVVPNNDKPMSCNKIWDRLQSMEKFRNGEIDIDNLCSELRSKAKCSEGGAVVDKKDVDRILGAS